MKYKIGFINFSGHYQSIVVENVSYIEVKEGVYLLYDDSDVLLYAIKITDVTVLGNVDALQLNKE